MEEILYNVGALAYGVFLVYLMNRVCNAVEQMKEGL